MSSALGIRMAEIARRAKLARTLVRGGGVLSLPRASETSDSRCSSPASSLALALACLPWLALLVWLTWTAWFMADDAFISFRYARNLLEGNGLVFNPGERVEGYSNFLWVLELAALWGAFGLKPEHAAQWLSVGFTVATVGAMAWWIYRLPALRHRALVGWMALGLVCGSATFAMWTSAGGLETRQFTFFIVLAVVCLSLYRHRPAGLFAASLSLAAAAYTRPEGPLIAVCCFGWFIVQSMADAGRLRVDWRALARLIAPFAVLVAAHYLFRYAYYGEWLPNTYYAKHVRPWYESGFRYLWAAALDTGLYLLIPLAWVAARRRWRDFRDGSFALVLLLAVIHMAYVMRIGGDHFEYRPLDFYWPLLAPPAAVGIVYLAARLAAWLANWLARLPYPRLWRPGTRFCALLLFAPAIFYASAIQGALLFEGAEIRERIRHLHIELDDENASWLLAAPGMPALVAISNDLRRLASPQLVAAPLPEHREFANQQMRRFQPYDSMERGIIPDDALMASGAIGIRFYYLSDLKVIDTNGLIDKTVARNPVTVPNHQRVIAHDRSPPPGYLGERGVNFTIYPAASSESEALRLGDYAVNVAPGLWMPFRSAYPQWVAANFEGVVPEVDYGYLASLIAGSQPAIRSVFDVHLHPANRLIYVKDRCSQEDADVKFFLHIYPLDADDLPDHRNQYGFDNLDFRFDRHGVLYNGVCVVDVPLPEYDFTAIRTGQYAGEVRIWEGEIRLAP